MMMPPVVFSSASTRRMTTRSCNGRNPILNLLTPDKNSVSTLCPRVPGGNRIPSTLSSVSTNPLLGLRDRTDRRSFPHWRAATAISRETLRLPKTIAIAFETGGSPDSHRCRLQRVIYTYVHEITLLERRIRLSTHDPVFHP